MAATKTSSVSGGAKATIDHDEIREWVESHAGRPTIVKRTTRNGRGGILRIDFPGYSGEKSLEEVSWDDFLRKVRGLATRLLVSGSGAVRASQPLQQASLSRHGGSLQRARAHAQACRVTPSKKGDPPKLRGQLGQREEGCVTTGDARRSKRAQACELQDGSWQRHLFRTRAVDQEESQRSQNRAPFTKHRRPPVGGLRAHWAEQAVDVGSAMRGPCVARVTSPGGGDPRAWGSPWHPVSMRSLAATRFLSAPLARRTARHLAADPKVLKQVCSRLLDAALLADRDLIVPKSVSSTYFWACG